MLQILSWITKLFNKLPACWIKVLCNCFGFFIYYGLRSRRQILLKNLYIVFPKKTEKWRRKLARLNCCRWVETAWMFLVSSHWEKETIQKTFTISPALKNWIDNFNKNPKATVVLVPHLNLMESLTWLPAFFETFPASGVVYRPFRTKWFENWIRKTRERFGLQLISRKRGVLPLEKILKNNGIVSILFDQSAGETGCLTTFFSRLASSTDLPGRLVEKYNTDVVAIFMRRTQFCQGEFCIEEIATPKTALGVTLEANRWLESKLSSESCFYENWLWMHRRWKIQHWPLRRFNISQKRNWLPEVCSYFNWSQLPKTTQAWFRMPNWLGDCVMSYPILKAIRKARPDFCIHLVVQKYLAPLLQHYFPADFIHVLPQKSGLSYFDSFWKIRQQYPDLWVNFTNSIRSDIEAWCSGAPQRFGLKKTWRPLLTHTYSYEIKPNEHQTELWYRFAQNFGLKEPLCADPVNHTHVSSNISVFGCFLGSSNTPEKRWPMYCWQELIWALLKKFPEANCVLLGSEKDALFCEEILINLPQDRVKNLAGKTSLIQLTHVLETLDFIVGNDSGGMHLSNFLGIPTVGLFGPTNPSWGGPFYESPKLILQSPSKEMYSLSYKTAYEKIIEWLDKSKH